MGEKELRQAAEKLLLHHTTNVAAAEPLKMALANDPDLFYVLDYISRLISMLKTHTVWPTDPLEAVLYVRDYITEVLHIRLTETGWESTDD